MRYKPSQKDVLSALKHLACIIKNTKAKIPDKSTFLLGKLPKERICSQVFMLFALRPQISILTKAAINKLNKKNQMAYGKRWRRKHSLSVFS